MTLSFLCRASKTGKDGKSPIEFSLCINGKRKYVTNDRKVKASSFNLRTQKVYNDKATNDYLDALRAKLFTQETEMIKNGMEVTIDTFMDIYRFGFTSNTITILQLFREHNKQFEKKLSCGVNTSTTLDKYVVTMDYLASFLKTLKKDDIMIKDITPMFVEEFFVYLLTSMSNNTAIQKMKQLKKILRIAVEEGYIKASPFKMTLKKEQKEVQPLTIEEVRRIRAKKIDVDRMAKVRVLFVFECYTGLAFTDLVNLTSDNIITDAQGNEWIVKSRQKTKIQSTIPLKYHPIPLVCLFLTFLGLSLLPSAATLLLLPCVALYA